MFGVNNNPIDWGIITTFLGAEGEELPLRTGQHDIPGVADGFGDRHIKDGHGEVPDRGHIQDALTTGSCIDQGDQRMFVVIGWYSTTSLSGLFGLIVSIPDLVTAAP